jgi:hypothetical protein
MTEEIAKVSIDIEQEYKKVLNQVSIPNFEEKQENTLELNQKNESDNENSEKEQQDDNLKEEKEKPSLDFENLQKLNETLQKQLKDSKSWAHKKNKAYINAKKNFTDYLQKLQDDYLIEEEDRQNALKFFDEPSDDEITIEKPVNPFLDSKEKLDKEFATYKKYNKNSEDLEKNYQSFFALLPLFNKKEQEEIMNYMQNEEPEIVIDSVILTGSEIYNNLLKGAEEKGGIIPFVKSLNEKIENLTKSNKELEEELNHRSDRVSSKALRSTNVTTAKNEKINLHDAYKAILNNAFKY